MTNIGDRQYGLSINGDVFYTIPIVEASGDIAVRFYEGFRGDVSVIEATNSLPVGIGWELDNDVFVDNGSVGESLNSLLPGQQIYAFLSNNRVFGMLSLILSNDQKEMFDAAFSSGNVVGVEIS